MSADGSVTHWLGRLKGGDALAAQKLWEGYFGKLVRLARHRLRGTPRGMADEEDVALDAFDSFCRGAEGGRFPRLLDRDDLWQLLVMLTARKACDLARHERRRKRDPGRLVGEGALRGPESAAAGIEEVSDGEPTPAFAFQVAEELRGLLERLDDPELRSIALWKMENYTNQEIAAKLGCAVPTVERRLRLIRKRWKESGS